MKKMWCIPKEQDADFVAKMEDVLDIYARPYDKNCPVICIDEKPYQLIDEAREPLPMKISCVVNGTNTAVELLVRERSIFIRFSPRGRELMRASSCWKSRRRREQLYFCATPDA